MLDLRRIIENPEELEENLNKRNFTNIDMNKLKELIRNSKEMKAIIDGMRMERNAASKEIGALIGQGKKDEAETRKAAVKDLGDRISDEEKKADAITEELSDIILGLPNYLEPDVPTGKDEKDNELIREVGTIREFGFSPIPHYDIGEKMGILDFEGGVKLAGSRFYSYRGLAAQLERAIISFMLDVHTGLFGYEERWVPQLISDEGMVTTGQYPKFAGEFYRLNEDGLSLIPTAEVPLVNLYRDEIIPEENLPIALTAASSCFRREAGAAGRDTRGLVRVHQFQKVELVQLVHPEKSREIHEKMLLHAEEILKRLELPYRVIKLCSGDIGATAARTYDLEVWMPGLNRYLEISSISNCLDYQARRGKIRYRPVDKKKKPELLHTLNGSGLAAGRTMIAIMENYQKEDATFDIPDALKPYFNRIS